MKTKIRFTIILTLTFFQIIPMSLFRFISMQRNNQDLKIDSYFLAMPSEIKLQIIKEGIKSIIYNEDDLKISISKICNFLDALSKTNKELREFQYFFKKDLIKYVRFLKKKRELDLALKNVLLNEPENNVSNNMIIDLIQQGADPNVCIDELSTLNFIAKSKKFNDLFNILIDHGASINLKDELTENTPLINACISNNINIVKTLLNNPKTNVNAFNKSGNTALFEAAAKRHIDVVDMLLDNPNIDIYHHNNLGDNFICYSCIKTYGDTDNLFKLFLNNKKIKNVYESDLISRDNKRYKVLIFLEVIIKKLWTNVIFVKNQINCSGLKNNVKTKIKKTINFLLDGINQNKLYGINFILNDCTFLVVTTFIIYIIKYESRDEDKNNEEKINNYNAHKILSRFYELIFNDEHRN